MCLTLLGREEMTRYAPLAGSPDIELNAAGTEAKLAGGGPMRTETRPRARERSRHPLVLAGVVIVLLVVYSGWNWRPHPPHPPREFYGPPTLPPHLRHDGPVPGPASVRAHRPDPKYRLAADSDHCPALDVRRAGQVVSQSAQTGFALSHVRRLEICLAQAAVLLKQLRSRH